MPAGTYILRASSQDEQRHTLTATATVTVAADLSNLRLVLQPALSIPIVMNTEFTKTQSSQSGGIVGSISSTNFRGPAQYATVSINSLDGNRMGSYSTMEGMPDNPTLALRNVEPGRYAVQIMPNGPWYVQSATYGQTDLLRDDLVVTQGGGAAMEIVLRDDGGSISGSVVSDNAPARAYVLIVPERRSVVPPVQYAGESGVFRANMLAPGNYLVFAFDSIEGLEYSKREALDAFASRATRVNISINSSANVTLNLIKRGEP